MQKTTAEHGAGRTEEKQTLLSKTSKNYSIEPMSSKILIKI